MRRLERLLDRLFPSRVRRWPPDLRIAKRPQHYQTAVALRALHLLWQPSGSASAPRELAQLLTCVEQCRHRGDACCASVEVQAPPAVVIALRHLHDLWENGGWDIPEAEDRTFTPRDLATAWDHPDAVVPTPLG